MNTYYIPVDDYAGETLKDWTLLGATDENGQITIPRTLAVGRYYVSAMGEDGTYQRSPAAFILTVKKALGDLKLGDGNDDGVLNGVDAVLSLKYAAGTLGQAGFYIEAADVNGDGSVNGVDAVLILKYAAGTISRFPVE